MAGGGDLLGLGVAAAGAGVGLHALLLTAGRGGDGALVVLVTQSRHLGIGVAVAALGAGVLGEALGGTGGRCDLGNVVVAGGSDLLGLGLLTGGTGVGLHTFLFTGGRSGDGALVILVAQSGYLIAGVLVAALGAGIGGVALCGAGRSSDLGHVVMAGGGDLLGLGLLTAGTGVGLHALLQAGGGGGDGTLVILVAQSRHLLVGVAVAALGAGVGGVALGGAGGSSDLGGIGVAGGSNGCGVAVAALGAGEGPQALLVAGGSGGNLTGVAVAALHGSVGGVAQGQGAVTVDHQHQVHGYAAGNVQLVGGGQAGAVVQSGGGDLTQPAVGHVQAKDLQAELAVGISLLDAHVAVGVEGNGELAVHKLVLAQVGGILLAAVVGAVDVAEQIILIGDEIGIGSAADVTDTVGEGMHHGGTAGAADALGAVGSVVTAGAFHGVAEDQVAVPVLLQSEGHGLAAGDHQLVGADGIGIGEGIQRGTCGLTDVAVGHIECGVVPALDAHIAVLCEGDGKLAVHELVIAPVVHILADAVVSTVDMAHQVVAGGSGSHVLVTAVGTLAVYVAVAQSGDGLVIGVAAVAADMGPHTGGLTAGLGGDAGVVQMAALACLVAQGQSAVLVGRQGEGQLHAAGNEQLVGVSKDCAVVQSDGGGLSTLPAVGHVPAHDLQAELAVGVGLLDAHIAVLGEGSGELAVFKLVRADVGIVIAGTVVSAVDPAEQVVIIGNVAGIHGTADRADTACEAVAHGSAAAQTDTVGVVLAMFAGGGGRGVAQDQIALAVHTQSQGHRSAAGDVQPVGGHGFRILKLHQRHGVDLADPAVDHVEVLVVTGLDGYIAALVKADGELAVFKLVVAQIVDVVLPAVVGTVDVAEQVVIGGSIAGILGTAGGADAIVEAVAPGRHGLVIAVAAVAAGMGPDTGGLTAGLGADIGAVQVITVTGHIAQGQGAVGVDGQGHADLHIAGNVHLLVGAGKHIVEGSGGFLCVGLGHVEVGVAGGLDAHVAGRVKSDSELAVHKLVGAHVLVVRLTAAVGIVDEAEQVVVGLHRTGIGGAAEAALAVHIAVGGGRQALGVVVAALGAGVGLQTGGDTGGIDADHTVIEGVVALGGLVAQGQGAVLVDGEGEGDLHAAGDIELVGVAQHAGVIELDRCHVGALPAVGHVPGDDLTGAGVHGLDTHIAVLGEGGGAGADAAELEAAQVGVVLLTAVVGTVDVAEQVVIVGNVVGIHTAADGADTVDIAVLHSQTAVLADAVGVVGGMDAGALVHGVAEDQVAVPVFLQSEGHSLATGDQQLVGAGGGGSTEGIQGGGGGLAHIAVGHVPDGIVGGLDTHVAGFGKGDGESAVFELVFAHVGLVLTEAVVGTVDVAEQIVAGSHVVAVGLAADGTLAAHIVVAQGGDGFIIAVAAVAAGVDPQAGLGAGGLIADEGAVQMVALAHGVAQGQGVVIVDHQGEGDLCAAGNIELVAGHHHGAVVQGGGGGLSTQPAVGDIPGNHLSAELGIGIHFLDAHVALLGEDGSELAVHELVFTQVGMVILAAVVGTVDEAVQVILIGHVVGIQDTADAADAVLEAVAHGSAAGGTDALGIVGSVDTAGVIHGVAQNQAAVPVLRQGKAHGLAAGNHQLVCAGGIGIHEPVQVGGGGLAQPAVGHVEHGVVAGLDGHIAGLGEGNGDLAVYKLIAAQIGLVLTEAVVSAVDVAEQVVLCHIACILQAAAGADTAGKGMAGGGSLIPGVDMAAVGAGVGGVAVLGAGRRGHHGGVVVTDGVHRIAVQAVGTADAALVLGVAVHVTGGRHHDVHILVAGGGDLLGVHVAALGAGVGLQAAGLTGSRLGDGGLVAVAAAGVSLAADGALAVCVAVAGGGDDLSIAVAALGAGEGLHTALGTGGSGGDLGAVAVAGGADNVSVAVAALGAGEGLHALSGTGRSSGDLFGVVVDTLVITGADQGQGVVLVGDQSQQDVPAAGNEHFLTGTGIGVVQDAGGVGDVALGHVPVGIAGGLDAHVAVLVEMDDQLAVHELVRAHVGGVFLAGVVAAVDPAEQIVFGGSVAQRQAAVIVDGQGQGDVPAAGNQHLLIGTGAGVEEGSAGLGNIAFGHVPGSIALGFDADIAVLLKTDGKLAVHELIAAHVGCVFLAGVVCAVDPAEQIVVRGGICLDIHRRGDQHEACKHSQRQNQTDDAFGECSHWFFLLLFIMGILLYIVPERGDFVQNYLEKPAHLGDNHKNQSCA